MELGSMLGRWRWGSSLLLTLLQHFKSLIDGTAKSYCGSRTATQVCCQQHLHSDARGFGHQSTCSQFDLDGPVVNPHTRNTIKINEGSLLGTGRGYLNSWRWGNWACVIGH